MKFNPEDGLDMGPHCRNCHRGSTACDTCHSEGKAAFTAIASTGADNAQSKSVFNSYWISTAIVYDTLDSTPTGYDASAQQTNTGVFFKWERSVQFDSDWRISSSMFSPACADDGFSWPHRTLGWMMLKDDLFGLDFNGDPIAPGATRVALADPDLTNQINDGDPYSDHQAYTWLVGKQVHDLDSVCLDCHNPTIWNATSPSHVDSSSVTSDAYNDELLLRGLP